MTALRGAFVMYATGWVALISGYITTTQIYPSPLTVTLPRVRPENIRALSEYLCAKGYPKGWWHHGDCLTIAARTCPRVLIHIESNDDRSRVRLHIGSWARVTRTDIIRLLEAE